MSGKSTTPMMAQYRRAKAEIAPDTLLFFRLGDFYEMFFEDALVASDILGIALTKRQGIPMCGVPYHAAEMYLGKLLRAGKKVALCDQMEDPALAKGIVKREVTGIVTPGTVLTDSMLDAARPNYLAGLHRLNRRYGLAMLDLSTGDFWMEEAPDPAVLLDDLARYLPPEIILPESLHADERFRTSLNAVGAFTLTAREDWIFDPATAEDGLCRHFGVQSLAGFGGEDHPAAAGAAGALLHYVTRDLRRQAAHVRRIRFRTASDAMMLDESTLANLDLIAARGAARADAPTTLLQVLDHTRTAMGSRLLRDWLVRPLQNLEAIVARHDAVEALRDQRHELETLRGILGGIKDLERLLARLSAGGGNARDVRALAVSLARLPDLQAALAPQAAARLRELAAAIVPQNELVAVIDRALVEEPPLAIKEGGLIRKGYHAGLDELRAAAHDGKQWIAALQAREIERTGIASLKIRFNKVFGYFIEVTKSNLARVPADYLRKQTIVNGERFITPELKEYESKILGAEEKSVALEHELFLELREQVVACTAAIQQTAAAVAELDVLATFAERALTCRYIRPRMTAAGALVIREGRHPVVELLPESGRFVPNDTLLDTTDNQLLIITGPNMAGKSTYIRQVALIVIMAQMGGFVPAAEAEIGVVDRVFTRVGAGDDIARGRSTFMVEMQETANILNNATGRSLIVLDEIGRGTSTFDGISIAWSVAEYLHNHNEVKAKTLFATHYHELTDIALTLPGVKNYNVLVSEKDDRVVFLRKIVPGAADKSYGIQVARLAGLPLEVVARAKEILANLEEQELSDAGQPKLAQPRARKPKPLFDDQLSLFEP
ncbi:MAG TPA: DNA mismatch repair protein MutS [Kiritimatiellia bacterium]|jgi:DNA mismatch repair protein MutS|nr:DNA mismatch repair protein MutS [Kiritimatiellia bacterium]HQN79966.1 DNA mismatch repair protein MutS [Kiritimatiellia bacterium]HQQ60693.1 DNA mismatch repair protein MutS [Kiritimatiellia bacterium]